MTGHRNLKTTDRPQGRGTRKTLLLAGLLALAGLVAAWPAPPAAWAAPYTLGGTGDQQGADGNVGGADGADKTDSQAGISADSITVSGGNGGMGGGLNPGGNGGDAGLTVTNNLVSTTNAGDFFTAGVGGNADA